MKVRNETGRAEQIITGADLIRANQCDRCPAIAKARIDYDTGGSLFACGHHLREWYPETGAYEGITITYATTTIGAR